MNFLLSVDIMHLVCFVRTGIHRWCLPAHATFVPRVKVAPLVQIVLKVNTVAVTTAPRYASTARPGFFYHFPVPPHVCLVLRVNIKVKLVRQDAIHVLWGDLPMSQCRNLATIAHRVLIKTRQGKHLVCPVFLEHSLELSTILFAACVRSIPCPTQSNPPTVQPVQLVK